MLIGAGCVKSKKEISVKDSIESKLSKDIQLNEDYTKVLKYLDENKIEHFEYTSNDGASTYDIGEIDIDQLKKELPTRYKVINEMLAINKNDFNDNTLKISNYVTNAFNKLIYIQDFLQLLAENKGLSGMQAGMSDKETMIKNKQKMTEIFPLAFENSRNGHKIKAIIRNAKSNLVVITDLAVVFYFNQNGQFIKYTVNKVYTGL